MTNQRIFHVYLRAYGKGCGEIDFVMGNKMTIVILCGHYRTCFFSLVFQTVKRSVLRNVVTSRRASIKGRLANTISLPT